MSSRESLVKPEVDELRQLGRIGRGGLGKGTGGRDAHESGQPQVPTWPWKEVPHPLRRDSEGAIPQVNLPRVSESLQSRKRLLEEF